MKFYAKILLFGEYSILFNSMALAIPFSKLSGKLKIGDLTKEKVRTSNEVLGKFYLEQKMSFSKNGSLSFEKIEKDLAEGLYFDSDIPQKYGVGSSGALVAAWYDRYFLPRNEFVTFESTNLMELKKELSILESFFHRKSSGFDPLVSYLNQAVLLDGDSIKVLPGFKPETPIYILDTGINADTENQMDYFLNKNNNPEFAKKFQEEYIPEVNKAIFSFIHKELDFYSSVEKVSNFQVENLQKLFPKPIQELANHGLNSKEYFIKLCGSGGGGFVLVFAQEKLKANHFKYDKLIAIK